MVAELKLISGPFDSNDDSNSTNDDESLIRRARSSLKLSPAGRMIMMTMMKGIMNMRRRTGKRKRHIGANYLDSHSTCILGSPRVILSGAA